MEKLENGRRGITAAVMALLRTVPDSVVVKVKGGCAQESGLPDVYFTCAALAGRSVWIEVKAPGERLRRLQRYKLDRLRQAGAFTSVVHSLAEVEALLLHLHVLPQDRPEPVTWTAPLTDPLRQKFARRA